MRLDRIKRWQWMAIAIVVGAALAYARRDDPEALLSRLGEGVADQRWFERQLQRRVPLADGSTVPAFGRLTVYPMTLSDHGRRKLVYVVAGTALVEGRPHLPHTRPTIMPAPVGKLRPYFFIAPDPYQSLADREAGKTPAAGATVKTYLDGLKSQGVAYTYAWWADARYAAAAWVAGSFLLIGVAWPTFVNLLAFGTFRRPREEKGVSLWRVKSNANARPAPATVGHGTTHVREPHVPAAPAEPVPLPEHAAPATRLVLEPVAAAAPAHDAHKEFGAGREDFYPTELKAPHPTEAHGKGH